MAEKFTKIDNTSPIQTAIKAEKPEIKRSNFDLSRVKITNATLGTIIPIDCIETIPGDTFHTLKYIIALQARNPNVKKQLTGMRLYLHAYYNRWSDLWEGAQNFVDKGQSGKIELQMPTLRTSYQIDIGEPTEWSIEMSSPLSLMNYLDVPATRYNPNRKKIDQGYGIRNDQGEKLAEPYGNETINALPYVMYQKLYLEKYAPRNLIQNNKNWVPDNQRHFILPYNATTVSFLSYTNTDAEKLDASYFTNGTDKYINPNGNLCVPEGDEAPVFLHALHYRQKKGDLFNTALPFSNLIRGDTPVVNLTNINFEEMIQNKENTPAAFIGLNNNGTIFATDFNKTDNTIDTANAKYTVQTRIAEGSLIANEKMRHAPLTNEAATEKLKEAFSKVTLQTNIDAFTIANLEILSAIKIRQGMTNGRYNEQVKALFGYSPKAPITDAIYIGGSYIDIGQNEITQQSESATTPQGTLVGRLEAQGLCDCGSFHCDDYGYIMVVMSIVPDTYYKQGLDKWITKKDQTEVYNPLTNEMAPAAILNKELYWSGNPKVDNDLYGWSERNIEYKQRRNIVNGLCAIDSIDDSRYLSSQTFTETPTLSNSFVTLSPQNVDMGIFTSSDEPPFVLTIGQLVKASRPLPFSSVPKALKEN